MQSICFNIRFLCGASVMVLLSLAALVQGQELPEIAELNTVPAAQRLVIQQTCLPDYNRDGVAEYKSCVRSQVANAQNANQAANSAKVLDQFSYDDKYALQQSCAEYYGRSQVYTECLKSEVEKLNSIPAPDLTTLDSDELNALQDNCYEDQQSRGAPAYRSCLNEALARMLEIPRVDLSFLSAVEVNDMKLACINSGRKLKNANYRLCLAQALAAKLKIQQSQKEPVVNAVLPKEAIPGGALSDLNTTANSVKITEINNGNINDLNTGSANSDGDPAKVDPGNDSTSLAGNQPQPSVVTTTLENPGDTRLAAATDVQTDESTAGFLSRLTEDPVGTVQALEAQQYSKYLIFILPLIILLLCFQLLRLLLRKRDKESFATEQGQTSSVAEHDHRLDFLEETLKPAQTPAQTPPGTESVPSSEAPTGAYINPESHITEPPIFKTKAPEAQATAAENQVAHPPYQRSEFSQQISNKTVPEIKRLCTEFMLYWISYGEGNYNQNLKNHLLHSENLNEHELIKKWVLEQNPSAFVDLLEQIRTNFTTEEIRQTIKLMMAVLIKNRISPVQNTFFRFFADFGNLGSEWLEQEYQSSFGETLPPLPRPDDERWWQQLPEKAPENAEIEGNGRALCLKQLGLIEPASGEDIAGAYHRIALRCHPERFDQLGEKERNLALRYFDRCSEAHNFLLELEK